MKTLPEPGVGLPPDSAREPAPEPGAEPGADHRAEAVPEGWEGILAPGERILWQGRPDGAIDWALLFDVRSLFGVFFTGFALFWIAMASGMLWTGGSDAGPPLFFRLLFPLFGLPFVLVGLGVILAPLRADLAERRGVFYTLTDRAAFIATATRAGRNLARYPAEGWQPVLDDGAPGTVWFAAPIMPPANQAGHRPGRAHRAMAGVAHPRAGFRRIAAARQVYALMLQAQRQMPRVPPQAAPLG